MLTLLLMAASVGGCLATRGDLRDLQSEQARVRSELAAMQELLVDLTIRVQGNEVGLDRSQRTWAELRGEVDEMTGRVRELDARLASVGPVPPDAPDGLDYAGSASAFTAAELHYAGGDTQAAERLWGWIADRWPDAVTGQSARIRQARLVAARGEAIAAVDALLDLLDRARDPQVVGPAYLALADALHALGEYDTARRTLADLIRIQPDGLYADDARRRLADWEAGAGVVTDTTLFDAVAPTR
jgi:tetratricopeptide (TPR) repeat protein